MKKKRKKKAKTPQRRELLQGNDHIQGITVDIYSSSISNQRKSPLGPEYFVLF